MEDLVSRRSCKSAIAREEKVENFVVMPPDGGWGWVVVAAAFGCNLITDGIIYTYGILLSEIAREFGVSIGTVTMIGSIQTCFYYIVGPFVSALLNRFGFRSVAILGSFIAATGYAISSLLYNFYFFVLASGIITGIGFGMINIPSIIVCGYYFARWRALATGIATCGSGIGTLIAPPLITMLLNTLGWRNTYLVMTGFILFTGILAMFYRPLQPVNAVQSDEEKISMIPQTDSIGSFHDEETGCCNFNFHKHHNIHYPTTAENIPLESVVLKTPDLLDVSGNSSFVTFGTGTIVSHTPETSGANDPQAVHSAKKSRFYRAFRCFMRFCLCGFVYNVSRPMYRDDIFFPHSLMLLPQYQDSLATYESKRLTDNAPSNMPKSVGYHMSVTRVTTRREIYGDGDADSLCKCPLSVLRTLSTMLDCHLLRSPAFQVFSWSGMFIVFGYLTPYLYIKDRAIANGVSPNIAFWLVSTIGAANTVGRILCGILPSLTKIHVIIYSYACIFIAGLMTAISGLCMRIEFQFFYASIYGLTGSCIATLRPIIVVELFGLEHLTNAFGLQLMFIATAGFAGTMIGGIVYDATKNFNMPFYISGGSLMFASLLLMFVKKVRNCEKKRNLSNEL